MSSGMTLNGHELLICCNSFNIARLFKILPQAAEGVFV